VTREEIPQPAIANRIRSINDLRYGFRMLIKNLTWTQT